MGLCAHDLIENRFLGSFLINPDAWRESKDDQATDQKVRMEQSTERCRERKQEKKTCEEKLCVNKPLCGICGQATNDLRE